LPENFLEGLLYAEEEPKVMLMQPYILDLTDFCPMGKNNGEPDKVHQLYFRPMVMSGDWLINPGILVCMPNRFPSFSKERTEADAG